MPNAFVLHRTTFSVFALSDRVDDPAWEVVADGLPTEDAAFDFIALADPFAEYAVTTNPAAFLAAAA